jgi:HK97 family phage prohead protease
MTAALELRAEFADPGYQDDKKPRYPIGDADHVRAALAYIDQGDNASAYTPDQLAEVKSAIKAAAKRFGIEVAPERSAELMTLEERWALGQLFRYNDFHAPAGSSTGGQFSSGNGGKSGPKGPAKKAAPKGPAKKPMTHHNATTSGHGNFAFDGHRGPGYGMKNGDPGVHKLQDDLVRLGLAKKGDKNLSDGKYGPKTSAAVKRAQKALGMKADGIATPAFMAKLKSVKALPHRSAGLDLVVRSFGFELEARGDGRTLEGYAAVFNSPTRIRDIGGDFDETILPGAFSRSIGQRTPILQWDHGKDPRVGTVPIGAIQDLGEDSRGLFVRARLFENPVVEPVRQAIEGGAVKGMSFRFGVPENGDVWPTRDKRDIRDADVHELGPVAFPAYDTTSVSVRSLLAQADPDERRSLIRELAEEMAQYADLSDLTGRSAAWSGDGGDPGAEPDSTTSTTPHLRQRLDDGALRARGILL